MKVLFSMAMMLLVAVGAYAQYTVTGTVIDAESSEPIIGCAVMEAGTTNGVVTDIDGNFTLNVNADPAVITFSYLGYKTTEQNVAKTGAKVKLGAIKLESDSKALEDVVVVSSIAKTRKTPVALSSIDPTVIEEKLGNQELPELLNSTPGIYATKQGGGYGDSELRMRGFGAANIAVLVNGVPQNDMEWGGVYWSNWKGLGDVTRSMQVQRGLGASKVSSPSVGGSMNIITKTLETKSSGSISYATGNDGFKKVLFSVSSGMNEKGWAFSVLGAKEWGDGYVQGTEYTGYNWFVNISKRLNDAHQLSFTAFGAPQEHYQRSNYDGLTIEGWQKVKDYMKGDSEYKYNPTYGFGKNGERKTSSFNHYHKPQIALNHQWEINEHSSLSTALYTSIGRGYGRSGQGQTSTYANYWYGSSNGTLNTTFRNADGTFAYDQIQDMNEKSQNGSLMAMSISKNYHNWYGLLSTYTNDINENLNVSGGVDFRYYKGTHTNELLDLYNGSYYMDVRYRANVKAENNKAAADPNFKYQKLGVGDVVYRDYDGFVIQGGAFAQVEYSMDKLNTYVSGSLSNTTYWRYDRFYYDADHAESDKVSFLGYTVKGGANYNIDDYNNVFANVGFISRAPFFSGGAFLSSTVSNATNPDAINEKVFSAEVGYGLNTTFINMTVNGYYTKWMDKLMNRSSDFTYKNSAGESVADRWTINMEGVDACHMGAELELTFKPASWFDLKGMLSIGNWIWDTDTEGYFFNSAGQAMTDTKGGTTTNIKGADHAKMHIVLDKVKVGGSAQTTSNISATVKPIKGLRVTGEWQLYARNYADWSFSSNDIAINSEKTYSDPWQIPSANVFNARASYAFTIAGLKANISGSCNNLFNQEYISTAVDGDKHDWKTAYRIFYGFGRTGSVSFKLSF